MTDLRVNARLIPAAVSDDDHWMSARATRDGALFTANWIQSLCLEGRVYGVQVGDAAADPVGPGTFGAGAVDLDEIDYLQTVPATVVVMPLYFGVAFVATGTAGEAGIHLVWGSAGVIGANSISLTPFNMRPGSSNSSACTVAALGDDGGTAVTVAGVIYENTTTSLTGAANTPQQFVPPYSAATAGFVPIIEGLASPNRLIAGWCNGQASTGYITSYWAELPIARVS